MKLDYLFWSFFGLDSVDVGSDVREYFLRWKANPSRCKCMCMLWSFVSFFKVSVHEHWLSDVDLEIHIVSHSIFLWTLILFWFILCNQTDIGIIYWDCKLGFWEGEMYANFIVSPRSIEDVFVMTSRALKIFYMKNLLKKSKILSWSERVRLVFPPPSTLGYSTC